ncbi:MAG: M1 family metallopeptidase [Gemmatimonadota bacterium]
MSFGLLALALTLQQSPAASPRPPYWQQRMTYEITASLDEPKGVLSGTERVTYVNHSPDTLQTFSFHLYLNAFRPGSRWADVDSAEERRRFNDLKDPDYGFNHISDVRIMGETLTPVYPFASDSTIVRYTLPHPLAPGDSLVADLNWDARPSTTPRRQGRRGRAFDFAQWYPRVVAYDTYGWEEHPLYPAGEFYGDFGTFNVLLDVPEDQVVGSTGVPVCGDPGWEKANRVPGRPVEYQRDYYHGGPVPANADDCNSVNPGLAARFSAPTAAGRKRIYWYADDVHHFAMSMRPDYRYEGGHWGDVAVHVLYQPGDEATWGNGIAVKRTEVALQWLDGFFGKFAWPQLTNVHRIEGGGTEFPMMIHDGGPDQGLIVHELGHNYVMGILASNEWKEGFLDEGFTSFQSALFDEAAGEGSDYQTLERGILGLDLEGFSEPTSLVSEDYRDFTTYNIMIYSRGELFFHQLRAIVGDSTLRQIMRVYYDRWKLKHVDEQAFMDVAEEVSHMDLSDFFGQWLHSTDLYDYAAGKVRYKRLSDGRWHSQVEVRRLSPGIVPAEVAVINGKDTTIVRTDGRAERKMVEIVSAFKPKEVVVDPHVTTHDWNMLNNARRRSWIFGFVPFQRTVSNPDLIFKTRTERDRMVNAWLPLVWYNDQAGITLGFRTRSNYLGRYNQSVAATTRSTGWANPTEDPKDWGAFFRIRNPTFLRSPRASQTLEVMHVEGRDGVFLSYEQGSRNHLGFGPTTTHGVSLRWLATQDTTYLNPAFYQNAGIVEAQVYARSTRRTGPWLLAGRISLGGGVEYLNNGPGVTVDHRYDVQPYFRGTLDATARRPLGRKFTIAGRFFAGVAKGADNDVVRQRRIYVSGADPLQKLNNPFTRSRGALLVRPNFNYHTPGDGDVRGYGSGVSGSQVYAMNLELQHSIIERPGAHLFSRVSLALFGDAALTDANPAAPGIVEDLNVFADAGIGLRAEHRIGDSRFTTRFDIPLYLNRPLLSQDNPGTDEVKFRWALAFSPAF